MSFQVGLGVISDVDVIEEDAYSHVHMFTHIAACVCVPLSVYFYIYIYICLRFCVRWGGLLWGTFVVRKAVYVCMGVHIHVPTVCASLFVFIYIYICLRFCVCGLRSNDVQRNVLGLALSRMT